MLSIKKIKQDYEKGFLDLLTSLIRVPDTSDPGIIWWVRNDEWYMQQDEKTGELLCHYDRVWSVISSSYNMQYTEIKEFIRDVMEKQFKLGYLTPYACDFTFCYLMEKQFKLGYLTPWSEWSSGGYGMEKQFKLGYLTPNHSKQ